MLEHHDVVLAERAAARRSSRSPDVHRAVAALYLRVGSRFETPDTTASRISSSTWSSAARRACPRRTTQALAFERLGGTLYAATHVDHGVMIGLGAAAQPRARAPAARRGDDVAPRSPTSRSSAASSARRSSRTSTTTGATSTPTTSSRALMYEEHPLGFTITGGARHARALRRGRCSARTTRATTRRRTRCSAWRAASAISTRRAARRAAPSLRCPAASRVPDAPPPNGQKKPRFRFVENQSSQTDLRIAFRAPSERDRDRAAPSRCSCASSTTACRRASTSASATASASVTTSPAMFEATRTTASSTSPPARSTSARWCRRRSSPCPRSRGARPDGRGARKGEGPPPLVGRGDARRPRRGRRLLRPRRALAHRAHARRAPREARRRDRCRCARRRPDDIPSRTHERHRCWPPEPHRRAPDGAESFAVSVRKAPSCIHPHERIYLARAAGCDHAVGARTGSWRIRCGRGSWRSRRLRSSGSLSSRSSCGRASRRSRGTPRRCGTRGSCLRGSRARGRSSGSRLALLAIRSSPTRSRPARRPARSTARSLESPR